MLVISIAIFIGYVWPEINNVKTVNRQKAVSTQLLQTVKNEQAAIGLVSQQIADDREGAVIVSNYLPEQKVEERVIGGVNYLAMDAGVSLTNIALRDSKNINATGTAQQTSSVADGSALSQAAADGGVQFSEFLISITGDYGKIRLFLDQLQKMTLFNSIKSLTIANQISSSKNVNADGTSVNSTDLVADLIVDFGYLPKSADSGDNKIAEFKSELDKTTIDTLKQYVSQKTAGIAAAGSYGGDKGRTNPFLP